MPAHSFLPASVTALQGSTRHVQSLFAKRTRATVAPGLVLRVDVAAQISGQWSSPAGRLLELETHVIQPGAWLALHIALDLPDLTGIRWVGVVARTTAMQATTVRVCLRSVLANGFHDQFFARDILSRSVQSDHHDLLDPTQFPDLPLQVKRRELVLFLPPATPIAWALHDLAVFRL